jgi:hypothetical protein
MAIPLVGGLLKGGILGKVVKGVARVVKKVPGKVLKGVKKVVKPSSLKKAAKAGVAAAAGAAIEREVLGPARQPPPQVEIPETGIPPEMIGGPGAAVPRGVPMVQAPQMMPQAFAGAGGRGGPRGLLAGLIASGQIPVFQQVQLVARAVAPPGYVVIRLPSGQNVAVLREVAYALGIRRRPSRAGISARDIRAAKKVQRLVKRLTVGRKARIPLRATARGG